MMIHLVEGIWVDPDSIVSVRANPVAEESASFITTACDLEVGVDLDHRSVISRIYDWSGPVYPDPPGDMPPLFTRRRL